MRIRTFTPLIFLLFLCFSSLNFSVSAQSAQCIANQSVNLDANGNFDITPAFIDNGNSVGNLSVSPASLTCATLGFPNLVTLTAEVGGVTNQCNVLLTPLDATPPNAECVTSFDIFLSALGQAQLFTFLIDNGSNDNCDQFLNSTLDQQFFTCNDIGMGQTVTLTVTDDAGLSAQCQSTVNVMDFVPPVVPCQNLTVELNAAGTASITAADLETGTGFDDVCGIASVTLDMPDFDCMNIGVQQVTVVVTDNNGNSNNCMPFVTVEDNIAPMAMCQNATVFLDANGNGNITITDIDAGSNDNCGITNITIAGQTVFDCFNAGQNIPVILNVTDNGGTTVSCNATVAVFDNIAPTVSCQDAIVQLDANGNGSIIVDDILVSNADACGIASQSLDNLNFNCGNVGANPVTLTVIDNNGNPSTCTQNVQVQDNVNPTVLCQNTSVVLDANGNGSIAANDVHAGSTDNCGVASISVNPTNFGCNQVGMSLAVLTATDVNGNSASCNATVLVSDVTSPNMVCQNIDIFLDANGETSIVPTDIDGGSTDACGIMNLFANKTNFTCDDIGVNPVILTGVDPSGNGASCIAMVNVIDNIPAVIACRPTIHTTADLDVCGKANLIMLSPFVFEENCSIANISNDAPTIFPVGFTTVTWSITDAGGNISNCTQPVIIQDNNPPTIECGNSFVGYTTEDQCEYPSYLLEAPTVADNCGVASVTSDAPASFGPGNYMVMWTATDIYGNESGCMQWVKVFDLIPPTITSCPENMTLTSTETDGSAQGFFDDVAGFDNCGPIIFSTSSHDSGDYFPLGDTEVTMTVYDGYGNPTSCSFVITIEPIMPSQNLTVDCMPTLEVSIDSEIEIGNITWNAPMTESNCTWCEVNSAEELTHLGFFNGSNYYIYNAQQVTFSQANFLSSFYGGKLVIINNEKENTFLSNEMPVENAYFGLLDNNGDGTLTWVNGDEFETFDWQAESVEILDFPSGAVMNVDGTWAMQSLNEMAYFLMEIPCTTLEISIEDENEEILEYATPETTSIVQYLAEDECGNQDACEFDIIFTSDVVPYCGSEGVVTDSATQRFIHKFSIGNYQNESGNNYGYGDFTNVPIELIAGETMDIATNFGPTEFEGSVYCRMWIDLNGDGDFYDEGEMVMEGIDEFSMEGELVIPFLTNPDITETQMRLSIAKYTFPEPCGNIPNGEVEDYTVKLEPDFNGLVQVNLNGLQNGVATQLHWLTNTQRKINHYKIERSVNGQPFEEIGFTTDLTKINKSKTYGFLDTEPVQGENFYRVLVTLNSGETFYTNTIQTQFGMNPKDVILMPNPADERIQVSMKELAGKSAYIKVYNSLGYEVKQKSINQITNAATTIHLDGLTDGLYQMWIFVEGRRAITKSFVVDKLNGYVPGFD